MKIKHFGFLTSFFALFLFAACSTPQPADMTSSLSDAATAAHTRAASSALAAEYKYKVVAAFAKGQQSTALSLDKLADFADKRLSLVVLLETGTPWAASLSQDLSKTGDDAFNAHLSEYNLLMSKFFNIDDFMDGLVLEAKEALDPKTAVDAARDLSMIEGVAMVEVKEAPQPADNPTTETAKN